MQDRDRGSEVLLLHSGALGDFVLAYWFACGFVDHPGRRLAAIARHAVVRWFARRGLVAEGRTDDAAGTRDLYGVELAADAAIAPDIRRFGTVISFLGGTGSAVADCLRRLSTGTLLCIDPAADGSARHITDQWLEHVADQVRGAWRRPVTGEPLLARRDAEREQLRTRCGFAAGRTLVLHPGSGGRAKCAPLEIFQALQQAATGRGWHVVWMIGPDELERDGQDLVGQLPASRSLIVEPSIGAAADLLAGGDAFCGNDSGMAHLAAAIGLNAVVWFGPTEPAVWRPLGPRVTVLRFIGADSATLVGQTLAAIGG
jgi:heptosyltransferase III